MNFCRNSSGIPRENFRLHFTSPENKAAVSEQHILHIGFEQVKNSLLLKMPLTFTTQTSLFFSPWPGKLFGHRFLSKLMLPALHFFWHQTGQISSRHDRFPPISVAFWKGNGTPKISGKSRLVKYYSIWPDKLVFNSVDVVHWQPSVVQQHHVHGQESKQEVLVSKETTAKAAKGSTVHQGIGSSQVWIHGGL